MFENVQAFHRPASVREALQLLQGGKGRARVVAGGTDLVVQADDSVRVLIDITRAGLSYIRRDGDGVAIGATTTLAELEDSPIVRELSGGILWHAAASCGSMQIRNLATIGGNMANGSPAADLATPLLAMDARVTVANGRSRRKTGIAEYLATTPKTRAQTLVLEVSIPKASSGARTGWSFQKLARTAVDISIVNAAAGLRLDARGRVKWVRLALGAVAPAPLRMAEAEDRLAGQILTRELLDAVGSHVAETVSPITDQRATAEYRRDMSRVFTIRALRECAERAGWPL